MFCQTDTLRQIAISVKISATKRYVKRTNEIIIGAKLDIFTALRKNFLICFALLYNFKVLRPHLCTESANFVKSNYQKDVQFLQ